MITFFMYSEIQPQSCIYIQEDLSLSLSLFLGELKIVFH